MEKMKIIFGGLVVLGFAISCNCDDSYAEGDKGMPTINGLVNVIRDK